MNLNPIVVITVWLLVNELLNHDQLLLKSQKKKIVIITTGADFRT